MKFTAQIQNGFAKFEVYDCRFKKPTTIAKHLMEYVEKKTGVYGYTFFDNWKYFWDRIQTKNGDYHHQEKWFEDYTTEECKEVPEYLAWVVDITVDADGDCSYMYFGFDTTKTGYKISKDFVPEIDNTLDEE